MKIKLLMSAIIVTMIFSCKKEKEREVNSETKIDIIKTDSGYVKSGNAKLFYKSMGQGKPVIVLHGGPGGYFKHDYPYLKDLSKDFRMIFFDQRGTGKSSSEINETEINTAQFMNDINVLSDSLKIDKFHLLGVSWGGLLSMMYTLENPDRVDKIVLIGTAGLEKEFLTDMNNSLNQRLNQTDVTNFMALEKGINETNIVENKTKQAKIMYKAYVKDSILLDTIQLHLDINTAKFQSQINPMMWKELRAKDFNFYPKLNSLQHQLLVIHGEYDPIPTKYSQKIVDEMSNAKMELLDTIGHMPHIETNALTLQLIANFYRINQ